MVARPGEAASLTPGSHGSTFGVARASALAVMDALQHDGVIRAAMGTHHPAAAQIASRLDNIAQARGQAIIIGTVLKH